MSGSATVYNPFLYTGQELDKETGFYHLRARHYAPSLGKFLSRDPIGYAGGSNLYSYCGGDPINYWDPDGLQPNPSQVAWETAVQTAFSLQTMGQVAWSTAEAWLTYEGLKPISLSSSSKVSSSKVKSKVTKAIAEEAVIVGKYTTELNASKWLKGVSGITEMTGKFSALSHVGSYEIDTVVGRYVDWEAFFKALEKAAKCKGMKSIRIKWTAINFRMVGVTNQAKADWGYKVHEVTQKGGYPEFILNKWLK